MKVLFSFFFIILTTISLVYSDIQHSIIPLVDHFENLSNLERKKYGKDQFEEIRAALCCKEEKIRVMSYNVLFNLFEEERESENHWIERLPRMVELIKEMKLDIFGVQELYEGQFQDLVIHLSSEFDCYRKDSSEGELNTIFYRKDRFEFLEGHVWFMTNTPEIPSYEDFVGMSETLTMVKLKDRKTGQEVAIFNTHLDFQNIDKRAFQAKFIQQYAECYAKQMPVILMGDLNTFAARLDLTKLPFRDGDYIHRILRSGSLRNAQEQSLLGHLGPISSFTNHGEDPKSFRGTGLPGIFLDYIYVSPDISVLIHATEPAKVNGHYPSDHLPIFIDCVLLKISKCD